MKESGLEIETRTNSFHPRDCRAASISSKTEFRSGGDRQSYAREADSGRNSRRSQSATVVGSRFHGKMGRTCGHKRPRVVSVAIERGRDVGRPFAGLRLGGGNEKNLSFCCTKAGRPYVFLRWLLLGPRRPSPTMNDPPLNKLRGLRSSATLDEKLANPEHDCDVRGQHIDSGRERVGGTVRPAGRQVTADRTPGVSSLRISRERRDSVVSAHRRYFCGRATQIHTHCVPARDPFHVNRKPTRKSARGYATRE